MNPSFILYEPKKEKERKENEMIKVTGRNILWVTWNDLGKFTKKFILDLNFFHLSLPSN